MVGGLILGRFRKLGPRLFIRNALYYIVSQSIYCMSSIVCCRTYTYRTYLSEQQSHLKPLRRHLRLDGFQAPEAPAISSNLWSEAFRILNVGSIIYHRYNYCHHFYFYYFYWCL